MNVQAASRPDETEPHGPSLPPRVVASRPRRLLLAEDDPSLRQMLVSAFLADGFEVVAAADGLELLANIEGALEVHREKADAFLVVADVHMPGLTGLDVLAILRCAGRQTPVILITAFGDSDTCAEALELGAAAVLDKPFDLDQLLSEARRALPTR